MSKRKLNKLPARNVIVWQGLDSNGKIRTVTKAMREQWIDMLDAILDAVVTNRIRLNDWEMQFFNHMYDLRTRNLSRILFTPKQVYQIKRLYDRIGGENAAKN